MGLAAPLQLFWAMTLVAIVLLYARWARRNVFATSALPIWKDALARRTIWSRWRRAVSLLAACVPVVLVALALARPYLWPSAQSARTIVVVVDATASMSTEGGEQSRLVQAKRQARRLIADLRTHERMEIISADSAVQVRCGSTSDIKLLYGAVDRIQPTDGAGAMPAAIATAQRLAADQRSGMVAILSDRAFAGADAIKPTGDLVWIPVGEPADNVAITRFAARPNIDDPTQYDVLVELANFSKSPVQVPIEFGRSGGVMSKVNVELAAGETAQRVMTVEVDAASELKARITRDDALPADNTASLLIVPRGMTHVVLVGSEENSPLAAALRSMRGIELEITDNVQPIVGKSAERTILIFDGAAPQIIPDDPALVFGPTAASGLWQYEGEVESPRVAASRAHAVLANGDLNDVVVDKAAKLRFGDRAEVIAAADDGSPLAAVVPRDSGDVIVLAFSLAGSDLALRDAFPRLLAAAIDWLLRDKHASLAQWMTASVFDGQDAAEPIRLTSPYGKSQEAAAGQSLLANLPQVGQWKLQDATGEVDAVLPVSLLNADESDLQPRAADVGTSWPYSASWPNIGPLSFHLIALALVWVVGQWVFYHRGDID